MFPCRLCLLSSARGSSQSQVCYAQLVPAPSLPAAEATREVWGPRGTPGQAVQPERYDVLRETRDVLVSDMLAWEAAEEQARYGLRYMSCSMVLRYTLGSTGLRYTLCSILLCYAAVRCFSVLQCSASALQSDSRDCGTMMPRQNASAYDNACAVSWALALCRAVGPWTEWGRLVGCCAGTQHSPTPASSTSLSACAPLTR